MFFDDVLNSYFEQSFNNFCLICGKNSNNISCQSCKDLILTLEVDNSNLIYFFKDYKYWMCGTNKYGEKIKSYGLYCIQRLLPIPTEQILRYIEKINLVKENDYDYEIQIITISNSKINLKIPKVKNKIDYFISYENLFLYPELDNLFTYVSTK